MAFLLLNETREREKAQVGAKRGGLIKDKAKLINKLTSKVCGRLDKRMSSASESKSEEIKFEVKSLILAQIERWRHA